jgi:hypothetical protein
MTGAVGEETGAACRCGGAGAASVTEGASAAGCAASAHAISVTTDVLRGDTTGARPAPRRITLRRKALTAASSR